MPGLVERRSLAGALVLLACGGPGEELAGLLLERLGLAAGGLRLMRDGLGRPWPADADGGPLPAQLSFSRLGGRLWAAAAAAPEIAGLGLDLAAPGEFEPPYPVARAFTPGERVAAAGVGLAGLELLALLWSLKEAGAKALGTGFHRLEPLDIEAHDIRRTPEGLACALCAGECLLPALAERRPEGWLALAARRGEGGTCT